MSTPPITPSNNPEMFEFFAFVVDGEVTVIYPLQKTIEAYIAAWSSDPKVLKLSEDQKNIVRSGWQHDESGFNPPY